MGKHFYTFDSTRFKLKHSWEARSLCTFSLQLFSFLVFLLGKPTSLQLEDGSGTLQGWHIGLHGIPPEIACGLRKVRVSSALNLHHADFLMTKDVQIRANQAATTLQVALRQNVEKRAGAKRCIGRAHLTSYTSLLSKTSDIQQAWDFFCPSCQATATGYNSVMGNLRGCHPAQCHPFSPQRNSRP